MHALISWVPFVIAIGISLAHFGWLWAGYNLFVGLVSRNVHRWEKRFGPAKLLWVLGITPVLGYLLMGVFGSWLGIVAGLLICGSRGITQVLLRDAFNWRISSHFRATANSIQSMVSNGICNCCPLRWMAHRRKRIELDFLYACAPLHPLYLCISDSHHSHGEENSPRTHSCQSSRVSF